jgi:hypothetical protein
MRKLAVLASVAVVLGLLVATAAPAVAAMKTHKMDAEVVSVDAKGKMITLKDDKGESHAAPVMGAAIAELDHVKAGDKVTVTCQDDEKGNHQGVVGIKKMSMMKK